MAKLVTATFGYRWVILGVCWLALIVALMPRVSVGPLVPFLKEDLNITSAQAGFFMSAAAFGYMLSLIPAGWLVDRIGVRWLLLVGETVGGIFLVGMFFVTTFTQGLIFMALSGFGMGCLMPSTTKAVLDWFPSRERATAMGLKQTAVNVGGIITAIILPTVALAFSWRYGLLGIGLIAVVVGIVSFILYREPPRITNLNISEPMTTSDSRPSIREILKNRDIWLMFGISMCLAVVQFSVIGYFVLYLEESLLFPVVTAGFFLAVLQGGGVFGKPVSGLISDRLFRGSRKKVYIIMTLVTFTMNLAFAFLSQNSPTWLIIFLSVLAGFGAVGWGGLHITLTGEFAGRELAGIATGMNTAFTMVAVMVGPPFFGYIVDTTGSYQIAWQFLAMMVLLATVFLLFVREEKKKI